MARRKPKWDRWFQGATFAIAVLGAITGVYGCYALREDREEEREVTLEVSASMSVHGYTNEGFGFRVSLVNLSLRPVTLSRAAVSIQGERLASASGYLPELRFLDRYGIEPAAVTDNRLELPLTIPARQERNVALLFHDIRSPAPGPNDYPHRGAERRDARDFYLSTLGLIKRAQVRLRLLLRPGGMREVPVRRLPGMTPRFEWQTTLVSPRRSVVAIAIRRKLGAPIQADRLRLDLWREPEGLHHEVERVVVGDRFTPFPLPPLPQGQYLYAFGLGNSVVRAGRFRSPDYCLPGGGHLELFPGDFASPPRPVSAGELPDFRPGIARRRPCRERLRGEFPIPLGPGDREPSQSGP